MPKRRHDFVPYVQRLRKELTALGQAFEETVERSHIVAVNADTDSVVFFGAEWAWGESDAELIARRMALIAEHRDWMERLRLLFRHPTPEVEEAMRSAGGLIERWLVRSELDPSIPATEAAAVGTARRAIAQLDELLGLAVIGKPGGVVAVPDTNALIRNPDLASYATALGTDRFEVEIVTTVLGELDSLKDRGHPDVRPKAQDVIRRFKGMRQGTKSLAAGVQLTGGITVRHSTREVIANEVLPWLDHSQADDRILGAGLRLQSDRPDATVVLVTSDMNLQNKADAAGLPYVETPPTVASMRANLSVHVEAEDSHFTAVIENRGPATARGITVRLESPEDTRPRITAGPWNVEALRSGESERRYVSMFTEEGRAFIQWTDDDGEHSTEQPVELPPRPAPRIAPRSFRAR